MTKAYKQIAAVLGERPRVGRRGSVGSAACCWPASSGSPRRVSASARRRWSIATRRAGRCCARCGRRCTRSRPRCPSHAGRSRREHTDLLGRRCSARLDEFWLSCASEPRGLIERGLLTPSTAEQATRAAATVGAGAAAKIVAFCIAAGGTATVCVNGANLLEHPTPRKPKAHRVHRAARSRAIVEPDRDHRRRTSVGRLSEHDRATIAGNGASRKARDARQLAAIQVAGVAGAAREATEFGPGQARKRVRDADSRRPRQSTVEGNSRRDATKGTRERLGRPACHLAPLRLGRRAHLRLSPSDRAPRWPAARRLRVRRGVAGGANNSFAPLADVGTRRTRSARPRQGLVARDAFDGGASRASCRGRT